MSDLNISKAADKIKVWLTGVCSRINAASDFKVFSSLALFYFVWRVVTLPLFECSGDAAWKWRFLRFFYETGVWFPAIPDHHQGRWAQNGVAYFFMNLFGSTDPWIGSIFPIVSGFFVLLFVYLICRKFSSKACSVIAVLMTAGNPVFVSESAQFLPSMPATMYVLLALYLLICYFEKRELWYFPLLAGIAIGLGWGCKVTVAYWAMGMGLFFLFSPTAGKSLVQIKKFHIDWDVLLFSLGFLLIFIPETIIINKCFDVQLGRFDMLRQHHGDNPRLLCFNLVEYIFSPFIIFLRCSGKVLNFGPAACLFLLVFPLILMLFFRKNLSAAQKMLFFVMTVALALHCYLVVRVFPFKHPERPLVRYFLTLFCVWNIIIVSSWHWISSLKENWKKTLQIAGGVLMFLLAILLIVNLVNEPLSNRNNLFTKIRAYQCIALHKEKNLPVLVRYDRGKRFRTRTWKKIVAWKGFIGDSRELPELQGEKLLKLINSWEKQTPVRDSDGVLYFHLQGKKCIPGSKESCVIIGDDSVRMRTLAICENNDNLKER